MIIKSILDNKGPDLFTVSPGESVRKLAKLFKRERIGFALVKDEDGVLVGTISERDIVQAIARKGEVTTLTVADIMTTNVVMCDMEDTADHIRELMTERRTRHVVVMHDGIFAGIVSIGDLIKHSLDECHIDTVQMRDYITGHGYQ